MKYENTRHAAFHKRLNRFSAEVLIDGQLEVVHVKNTGRCGELLLPGADVVLEKAKNPNRKTSYDLISVYKEGLGWVNIDSQVANKVVAEWLAGQDYDYVKGEYTYGNSRIDFYMEKGKERYLMEVKGCTLEIDGVGYFPDAPTERGIKHLEELIGASKEGYHCAIAFVIAMNGIQEVRPNMKTHPAFGEALDQAKEAGVAVKFFCCEVKEDQIKIV